ncbi:MAG: peptidase S8 and S53 subtilisin kexin sedolisin, partial [Chloroflexi bacterium]|nr:peptidase S8 and S53 subtilisin kexin sedolisin [Chloroflexota bacterium]
MRASWVRIVGLVVALGAVLAAAAILGGRASASSVPAADRLAIRQATAQTVERLLAQIQQGETRRVIVQLDLSTTPESKLPRSKVQAQRDRIARAQERLLSMPGVAAGHPVRRLTTRPVILLEVDATLLEALAARGDVLSITEDVPVPPVLAQSVPLIGADVAWVTGFTGAGWAVAILDTGVDKTHPFMSGKVIAEACFSSTGGGSTAFCAYGSEASGAGAPCNLAGTDCAHGTHVAGIAAGNNGSLFGVAKDASIIAIQVFSRFDSEAYCGVGEAPCALSWTYDQLHALEWLYLKREVLPIAAANLSLGGGSYTSACDANPIYADYAAVVAQLADDGIAT